MTILPLLQLECRLTKFPSKTHKIFFFLQSNTFINHVNKSPAIHCNHGLQDTRAKLLFQVSACEIDTVFDTFSSFIFFRASNAEERL